MLEVVQTINRYLSDYVLLVLLIGIGLFYTIKTRFVQVRCFGQGVKQLLGKSSRTKDKKNINSFQALMTAIAGQVGTGNIVGVSGAILIGGPGAIFWMWIIAFFGMATAYAEAVLAQQTKIKGEDGEIKGGPVYYITKAFKGKFGKGLAIFFSIATILALGFIGAMVQSNSIGSTGETAFKIPSWVIGLVITALSAIIFIGGAKRVASVAEKLVPLMAVLYILGSLVVICCRIQFIPETFALIFKYAFNPSAIVGGSLGYALKQAISQGVKRGLFSNEAGMGSTPHAHALANVKTPHEQGVVSMIGVFIDTFIVLTLTAIVVISTLYAGNGPLANGVVVGFEKTNLAQQAFSTVFGQTFGNIFVAVCLLFFAFSTILGWNLFGKMNMEYLFGKKSTIVYFIISLVFIFLGSILSNDLVWELSDMFNQLMVLPNVFALMLLSGLVVSALPSLGKKKKANKLSFKTQNSSTIDVSEETVETKENVSEETVEAEENYCEETVKAEENAKE